MDILSRDEFRSAVFARDKHRCVICGAAAVDAHHIIDRKLWPDDGGYYVANGASLCSGCHLKAEQTIISCEEIRQKGRITEIVFPPGTEPNNYDKWLNIICEDGMRIPGPVFHQENVQKILKPILHLFRK